jgi:adenylosuccinate lyase
MRQNLEALGGVVNSQGVLLRLARKGLDRQAAYELVQRCAMRVYDEGIPFEQALGQDAELGRHLSRAELAACFSLDVHFRHVDEVFARVFGPGA